VRRSSCQSLMNEFKLADDEGLVEKDPQPTKTETVYSVVSEQHRIVFELL